MSEEQRGLLGRSPSPATSWGLHFPEQQFLRISNGDRIEPVCGVVKTKEGDTENTKLAHCQRSICGQRQAAQPALSLSKD